MRKQIDEKKGTGVANDATVTFTLRTPVVGDYSVRFYPNGTFSAGTVNVAFQYSDFSSDLDSITDIDCTATQLLQTILNVPASVTAIVLTGDSMAGGTDWGYYIGAVPK